MRRICAWHKKYFGFELDMGEIPPFDNNDATHGICEDCYNKLKQEDSGNTEVQNETDNPGRGIR